MVIVLPDSVRNYMTKFLSKDWMIEKKFLELSEYNQEDHILNGKNIDFNSFQQASVLKTDATIQQAIDEFKNGAKAVVLANEKAITGVVFENKLVAALTNKKLKGTDLASKSQTKDFVDVPDSITTVQLERLLERNTSVFIVSKNADETIKGIVVASPRDLLNLF